MNDHVKILAQHDHELPVSVSSDYVSPNVKLDKAPKQRRLIEGDSAYRKQFPLAMGVLDYFPDALAAVAQISFQGNQKHNPGQPLHHSRGKSMDHADCIMRHLSERGGFDVIVIDGVEYKQRHSASLAWRSLALLQQELEEDLGLPMPRGAWVD
jgi:hypothetical protein